MQPVWTKDWVDFLDYFSKECAKENFPDLVMHAMNLIIDSNHS